MSNSDKDQPTPRTEKELGAVAAPRSTYRCGTCGVECLAAETAGAPVSHSAPTINPGTADCLTCHGDVAVCASVPGLRHCEKAMREWNKQATYAAQISGERQNGAVDGC